MLDALHLLPPAVRAKFRFYHLGTTDGSESGERYAGALRAQMSALGLERIVEWRGGPMAAREFLRDMDCLVLPAHREPLALAMLDALALGVPVLAANSGGARDVSRRRATAGCSSRATRAISRACWRCWRRATRCGR